MIKNIINNLKGLLKSRSQAPIVESTPVVEPVAEPVKKKAGRPKKAADTAVKKAAPKKKTA